jgi:site-specific DNA recombinase
MQTSQTNSQKTRSGAAYIRYSSSMQNDSFSLDAQLRQIKACAKQDGVVIVRVYSDEAQSAYSKKYRPGITAMLDDAKRGVFEVLYCHKIDRLARRLEWGIEIAKKLQKNDVVLKAVEQNFDLETPEGKLMFHLLGSLGEFYSDNLSKETEKGKRERVAQGYHNGQVPWGYISEQVGDRRMAVPKKELQPVVEDIFERCASGLYYDQEIADWLNEQGYRTRLHRLFTKDAVRTMLTNPMYKGYVRYYGAFVKGKSRKAAETLYKGKHVALVSEGLYERCQDARRKRRSKVKTRQVTRRIYLMSGVATCENCGGKLRAQSTTTGNRYYREVSKYRGESCAFAGKSVSASVVEDQLDELMQQLVLPDNWKEQLDVLLKEADSKKVDVEEERAKLRAHIRRLRKSYTNGLYADDEHVFWAEIEGLQAQLNALEAVVPEEVDAASQTLSGLADAWAIATPSERSELVKIIFDEIQIDIGMQKIAKLRPRSEYMVLFNMVEKFTQSDDGFYIFRD